MKIQQIQDEDELLSLVNSLYWDQFLPRQALAVLQSTIPQSVPLICALANILRFVGRYGDAVDAITRAFDKDPQSLVVLYTRARILYESAPGSFASKYFVQAEERYSRCTNPPPVVVFARMVALAAFKRYDDCLDASEEFLRISGDGSIAFQCEAHFRKATALQELRRIPEALRGLGDLLESRLPPTQRILLLW